MPFESIEEYFLCPYRYYIDHFDVWINPTAKTPYVFDVESGLRSTLQKPLIEAITRTVKKEKFTAGDILDLWKLNWEKQKGVTVVPNSSNFELINSIALETIIKVMRDSLKIHGEILPITDYIYYPIQTMPYEIAVQFKPDLLIYENNPSWKRDQAYFVYIRKEILPQDSYFAHYYLPFLFYSYLAREYFSKVRGHTKYRIGTIWIDAGLGIVWEKESIGNLYKGFTNKYMQSSIKTLVDNIKKEQFYRKTSILCNSCIVRHRCMNKIYFDG